MQVILMGLPGTGKGTQAGRITQEFDVPHISTGDMFRAAIAAKTEFGQKVEPYLTQGKLVPDDITIGVVRERLSRPDCAKGFLFDGFPRTVPQAEALDALLVELDKELEHVIHLHVPRDLLLERVTGRRVCRECQSTYHIKFQPPKAEGRCDQCGGELFQRADDNEEAFATRIDVNLAQQQPLLDYYSAKGIVRSIDGDQPMDAVWSAIRGVLVGASR